MIKRIWLAFALGGLTAQPWADCHIHAPDDYPNFSSRPLVIPIPGDRATCQSVNRERFGGSGRCHCTDDISQQPVIPNTRASERDGKAADTPLYLP